MMLAIMVIFFACQRNLDKDLLPNGDNLSANAKAQLSSSDTLNDGNVSMIEDTPELKTLKESFEKLKNPDRELLEILMITTIHYRIICGQLEGCPLLSEPRVTVIILIC